MSNNSSCIDSASYFSSPEFVANGFHVLTAIEVPIHIFVAFVIIFKTPPRMGNVKWYMFNVHFWSALLDVTFTFLVTPYFIFPATAGYSLGVFMFFGLDCAIQVTILVIEIGMTIISILILFENRYTVLANSRNHWKTCRKYFAIFLYIVAWTYFIPFSFQVPDPNVAVPIVLKEMPQIRCVYSGPIFVFTLDSTIVARITMLKLIVEFSYLGLLVFLTFRSLVNQAKSAALSKNTLALQRKFFSSIIVQTAIPFGIIILPIAYCGISLSQGFYNQTFNNFAFIVISSHGLISTVAILIIHEPYRKTLLEFFKCCKRPDTNRVSAAGSTS